MGAALGYELVSGNRERFPEIVEKVGNRNNCFSFQNAPSSFKRRSEKSETIE